MAENNCLFWLLSQQSLTWFSAMEHSFWWRKGFFDQLIWLTWAPPFLDASISCFFLCRFRIATGPNLFQTGDTPSDQSLLQNPSQTLHLSPVGWKNIFYSQKWDYELYRRFRIKTEWTPQWPNWLVSELSKLRSTICCRDD